MTVRRERRRDRKTGVTREFWFVDVVVQSPSGGSTRVRKVSPVQTRRGAEQFERLLRQSLLDGSYERKEEEERKAPLLRNFVTDFVEVYARTNNKPSEFETKRGICRNHLVPAFGHLRLDQIGRQQIERFKADKMRAGLAPKTVNNFLAVLGRMLTVAVEWDLIAHAPRIKWLRVPDQEFAFLEFSEAQRLIDAADEDWKPMIVTGLKTGLRLGALLALRWEDVDLVSGQLMVRRAVSRGIVGTPKGHRSRVVPLSGLALRTLKAHRHLKGELVFCNEDGLMLSRGQCRHPLWRACKRAGLRRIGWHVLRHTFASHLVMRGTPLKAVQELLGHRTIEMTMRYAHLSPDVRRAAVEVLDAPVEAGEPVAVHGNMTATRSAMLRK